MNDIQPRRLFNIYGNKFGTGYAGNVWDKEYISPAMMTMVGGNRQPMILVKDERESNTGRSTSKENVTGIHGI